MIATNTIEFVLSDAAKVGRVHRQDGYVGLGMPRPTYVVHVETANLGMVELDADDADHAQRLIDSWIGTHGNMSARSHRVTADGSLIEASRIFSFMDYAECE